VGRWHGVDNSAESYLNLSSYTYAGNNPVKYVDFDGNDYGVIVDRVNKKITIKAHYLTSSKTSSSFVSYGSNKWNAQSARFIFVPGSVKNLKKALRKQKKTEVYSVEISITSSVHEGDDTIESYTSRDVAADADETGTANSFDTVKKFRNKTQAGATGDNQVDVREDRVNSGATTHEVSHSLGIAHTDEGGTIAKQGGAKVGKPQVSESLMGVGIGGNNIARNSSSPVGDGTLLNNSSNEGLQNGKLISKKRYDRIVRRINRKIQKNNLQ
jgi:hypothetical protein